MKFVCHSRTVFKTFLSDFASFVAALENQDDGFILRNSILRADFLFNVLYLSDLIQVLAECSRSVQILNQLPWDYFHHVQAMLSKLENISPVIGQKLQSDAKKLQRTLIC